MDFISEFKDQDVEYCRNIVKQYSFNYYNASRFYPREIRKAIWIIYAFVRVSDQIVDDPTVEKPILKLGQWAQDWIDTYQGQPSDSPVLRAAAHVWQRYNIPFSYSEDFLAAMAQDLEKPRYETFAELKDYMYGSASVIGLIVSHIVGYRGGDETLRGAKLLGDAMQLTNFIRDVREDITIRNRIYLANEDMKKFGVNEEDLLELRTTENIRALIKYYIEIAHTWYEEAIPYINFLPHSSRLPIRMAAEIYEDILGQIERNDYDVFTAPQFEPAKLEKIKTMKNVWYYNRKYDRL
jgi:phytoene synthase